LRGRGSGARNDDLRKAGSSHPDRDDRFFYSATVADVGRPSEELKSGQFFSNVESK
jgi:hypothetical protein